AEAIAVPPPGDPGLLAADRQVLLRPLHLPGERASGFCPSGALQHLDDAGSLAAAPLPSVAPIQPRYASDGVAMQDGDRHRAMTRTAPAPLASPLPTAKIHSSSSARS